MLAARHHHHRARLDGGRRGLVRQPQRWRRPFAGGDDNRSANADANADANANANANANAAAPAPNAAPTSPSTIDADDPYGRAALRLEEVLAAARDNNAGFLSMEENDPPTLPGAPPPIRGLRLLPPDERLAAASQLGTLIGASSLLISWVCGADPLGGASLSQQSLAALGMGTLGAAPLLALALVGRTRAVRRAFPTLAAVQADTSATLRPLVRGLTPQQVLVMAVWLSLPSCLLLCPTARGVVDALRSTLGVCLFPASSPIALALLPDGSTAAEVAEVAATAMAAAAAAGGGGGAAGAAAVGGAVAAAAELPGAASDAVGLVLDAGAGLLPALLASYLAASAVAMALSPRAKQLAAVRDFSRSAERWFRLERAHRTGASVSSSFSAERSRLEDDEEEVGAPSSTTAPPPSSSSSSSSSARLLAEGDGHAFRALALEWARERRSVARLAFVLSAIQLMYVHELWDISGDVSSVVGALTAAWAAEMLLAARGDCGGSGGGSGGGFGGGGGGRGDGRE